MKTHSLLKVKNWASKPQGMAYKVKNILFGTTRYYKNYESAQRASDKLWQNNITNEIQYKTTLGQWKTYYEHS